MRNLDCKIVLVSLCVLQLFSAGEGRPPSSGSPPEPVRSKRTVSEVQLMHNLGEHRQVQERRQWLQMKLRGIHTAAARAASGEPGRAKRRLRPEELPELSDLTPEEIQYALSFLEKLLKSKRP